MITCKRCNYFEKGLCCYNLQYPRKINSQQEACEAFEDYVEEGLRLNDLQ